MNREKTARVKQAFAELAAMGDQPFVIELIKRTTGKYRRMVAVQGVSRFVKGVGLAFNPTDHNLRVVYDLEAAAANPTDPAKAYRMVNCESVLSIMALVGDRPTYFYREHHEQCVTEDMLTAFMANVEKAIGGTYA